MSWQVCAKVKGGGGGIYACTSTPCQWDRGAIKPLAVFPRLERGRAAGGSPPVVEIFGHDGLVRVDQFAVESVVGDHHGHLHEGAGTHLVANDEEFSETSILEHTRLVLHHQIRHLRFGESATEGMGGGGG